MLAISIGCSKKPRQHRDDDEEEPARRAATTASAMASATTASAASAQPSVGAVSSPAGPMRPSPLVMKTYRVAACRYGALSLKYARASYLESLGGKPPSVTLIPKLGEERAAPASSPRLPVRFERYLRHCRLALSVKDGHDADLDPALESFSDFAMPLARLLQEASAYYAQEKFKDDDCAMGRAYHQCLTGSGTCAPSGASGSSAGPVSNAFAQLDEQLLKLAAAVDRYLAAHPADTAGFSETRRLADGAVRDANALLMALDSADLATASSTVGKLEATRMSLEALADKAEDGFAWAKGLPPKLRALTDRAKEIAGKGKTPVPPEQLFAIVGLHSRVLDTDYSSLQRALRGPGAARHRVPSARPSALPEDLGDSDPP